MYAFEKGYPTTKHHCDTKNEPIDPAFTLHDCAHLKTKCPIKTIDIDADGNPIKRQMVQNKNPSIKTPKVANNNFMGPMKSFFVYFKNQLK
jgi:hypothetical protein